MKSGDIQSVTCWPSWKLYISEKIWLIAKIIQMLFCYCQQKLIQRDAYSSIFNKCITKFGNSIPGWGSSFQVQLTWLEEKKIKVIHTVVNDANALLSLKKKKQKKKKGKHWRPGKEYPFLFMRHHLFQPELFYILENPYEGKKENKITKV